MVADIRRVQAAYRRQLDAEMLAWRVRDACPTSPWRAIYRVPRPAGRCPRPGCRSRRTEKSDADSSDPHIGSAPPAAVATDAAAREEAR